ncbi:MAG: hypothetical protein ABSE73_12790 [Planctomycetota bacterium]
MPRLCELFNQDPDRDDGNTAPLHCVTTTINRIFRPAAVEQTQDLLDTLPTPGQTFHLVLGEKARWDYWQIVPRILSLAGMKATELLLTSLNISADAAAELCRLIEEGKVQRPRVLLSDWFRADKNYAAVLQRLEQTAAGAGGWCCTCRVHAKLILARLEDGTCFVSESSANLRSCSSVETCTVTNDRALFEFHKQWILAEHARSTAKEK